MNVTLPADRSLLPEAEYEGRIIRCLQWPTYSSTLDGLRDGLRELGLEEGKQFILHVRDTRDEVKSVAAAARSLEGEKVDLIVAVTSSIALAAKRGTKDVPIVFYVGTDPVANGLVESFRNPGGRLTGIHSQHAGPAAKRLELLKEMVPKSSPSGNVLPAGQSRRPAVREGRPRGRPAYP